MGGSKEGSARGTHDGLLVRKLRFSLQVLGMLGCSVTLLLEVRQPCHAIPRPGSETKSSRNNRTTSVRSGFHGASPQVGSI